MRRATLLLSLLALLLASCSEDTATSPDASASTSTGGPSAPAASSPTGVTMSDLAGAWTGNTIQEGMSSTWELQLTLEDCEIGEPCGTMETVTHDWDIMDRTIECSSTLTYEGYMDDLGDATQSPFPGGFTFRETVESGICSEPMLVLTPLQDGLTLGIQEYFEDWPGWLTYGVLRLDVTA